MSNETECPTCKGDGCKAERADAPLTLEPPHWMGPAPCDTCHGNGVVDEDVQRAKHAVRWKQYPTKEMPAEEIELQREAAGVLLADRCDELEAIVAEHNQGGKPGFQTHQVGTQRLSGAGMMKHADAMELAKTETGKVFILAGVKIEAHPTKIDQATFFLEFVPGNGVVWVEESNEKPARRQVVEDDA